MKKIKRKRELSVEDKDNLCVIAIVLFAIFLLGGLIAETKYSANQAINKIRDGCHCGSEYHFYYSDTKRYYYYYKCDNGHVIRTSYFIPT